MRINFDELGKMEPKKFAELLVYYYGRGLLLDMLKIIVEKLGFAKIAKAAGVAKSTIANAIYRGSIKEENLRKIVEGLLIVYPEEMRRAHDIVMVKLQKKYGNVIIEEELKKLEKIAIS
ncbi:MAG: hypothetical protein Q6351_007715 [Candidatus Njordarchaeum guaymaensis]